MRILSTIKIIVPLEKGRNAILALNRKRQFSLFNYGQYFLPELGLGININSTNSHDFRRWLAMPLDFIPKKDKIMNKSQMKNIA